MYFYMAQCRADSIGIAQNEIVNGWRLLAAILGSRLNYLQLRKLR